MAGRFLSSWVHAARNDCVFLAFSWIRRSGRTVNWLYLHFRHGPAARLINSDIMRAIYLLAFIVVVAIFPETESGVLLHGPKQSTLYQTQSNNAKYLKTSQKLTGTETSRNESLLPSGRKWGVSAWGIIALILGVIILSTITYYVVILYPYICRRDAAYEIIELPEVNSRCNVGDNIHNVPHRVYHESNDISNDVSNDAPLNR